MHKHVDYLTDFNYKISFGDSFKDMQELLLPMIKKVIHSDLVYPKSDIHDEKHYNKIKLYLMGSDSSNDLLKLIKDMIDKETSFDMNLFYLLSDHTISRQFKFKDVIVEKLIFKSNKLDKEDDLHLLHDICVVLHFEDIEIKFDNFDKLPHKEDKTEEVKSS